MHYLPPVASTPLRFSAAKPSLPLKRGDLTYEAVTVAAILLVLCTLWLF